jgi:hypothetical protein
VDRWKHPSFMDCHANCDLQPSVVSAQLAEGMSRVTSHHLVGAERCGRTLKGPHLLSDRWTRPSAPTPNGCPDATPCHHASRSAGAAQLAGRSSGVALDSAGLSTPPEAPCMTGPSGALLGLASLPRCSRGRNGLVCLPTPFGYASRTSHVTRTLTSPGKSARLENTTGRGEHCLMEAGLLPEAPSGMRRHSSAGHPSMIHAKGGGPPAPLLLALAKTSSTSVRNELDRVWKYLLDQPPEPHGAS